MPNFFDLVNKFNPMNEKGLEHTVGWLQARSQMAAILVKEGILQTHNDQAGFWRGEEWVSIYDLMDKESK